jgi:glutamate carboxypeptidase
MPGARSVLIFILLFSVILKSSLFAQQSTVEVKLLKIVDGNNSDALELLKNVVNINSGTMNFAGIKKVADIFRRELDKIGFSTRWIDGKPFNRAGHLIAEHPGPGKHLLLIGHLDTVFEPDSPFQSYEMVSDSLMKGPGVCDMKGGDVIIIYSLKALKDCGLLANMHITVIMTGDEENSGNPQVLAREDLIEASKKADISIGFEDGDGDPETAVISRRGALGWKLTVKGNPAHSSQIFKKETGVGAIYETGRILSAFYQNLAGEKYLTFSPGLILGGTDVNYDPLKSSGTAFGKNNVVAGQTIVSGDLRTISPQQLEKTKNIMRKIVSENWPGTSAQITFSDSYPPLAPSEANKKLLAIFDQVSRDLGYGAVTAVDPTKAGAADVSFTAPYVQMVIDGLGLGGSNGHTVNETADISLLPMQTKRAAVFLFRLAKQN